MEQERRKEGETGVGTMQENDLKQNSQVWRTCKKSATQEGMKTEEESKDGVGGPQQRQAGSPKETACSALGFGG